MQSHTDVLRFWFGDEYFDDPSKLEQPTYFQGRAKMWYMGGADIDTKIREQFADTVRAAGAGKLSDEAWNSKEGMLAKIILMDQMSRNAFRGTPEAFAYDEAARELTKSFVATYGSLSIPKPALNFLLSPLLHSEDIADLDLMIAEFAKAGTTNAFATDHREVLAKFGRYPHRNRHLGRETTAEEAAWLASPECPGWAKSQ